MPRTLPVPVAGAIVKDATTPVYLLEMGFSSTVRAATWDTAISWNGLNWIASGIEVANLSDTQARLKFPNGKADPWLALVLNEGVRGRSISIYEHHTDLASSPQTGAVLLFTGIMDELSITQDISLTIIESSQAKTFPPTSIDRPIYNYLLTTGLVLVWGPDKIVVN